MLKLLIKDVGGTLLTSYTPLDLGDKAFSVVLYRSKRETSATTHPKEKLIESL